MPAKRREKLLILTGSLGDGHRQAAHAVMEAAALGNLDAQVIDFMEWIHPRTHAIEKYCFLQGVKHFPAFYEFFYQKTRTDNALIGLMKRFRHTSLQRLVQLIREEQPTAIVSTFPPASAAVSLLKEKRWTPLFFATIITDHSDHSYWLHPHTDLYLVGSREVGAALRRKGVPLAKIAVTGIPVRPSFSRPGNKDRLREKLGLPPSSFVALVMGGGCGMIGADVIDQVRSNLLPPHVQFVFICGRNIRLLHRLDEAFRGRKDVLLKGFEDNIHEWMAAADVLLTKPGGLTTSEALALRLPMLLFEPKLGQERDNADYLLRKGVAVVCRSSELAGMLGHLSRNPELLGAMRERAERCGRRNSALHAIRHILSAASPAMSGDRMA